MNTSTKNRLQQIQIENKIWIIYLIIIFLSYQSNYYEKEYFTHQKQTSKNKYRKLNILIFTMLVLIYAYFEKESLQSLKNSKSKLTELSFIATTLVLIAGILYLYIVVKDKDIEEEIAFN